MKHIIEIRECLDSTEYAIKLYDDEKNEIITVVTAQKPNAVTMKPYK